MRGDISALTEITRGKHIKDRKKSNLLKKHNIKEDKDIPTKIEQLKQQVQAKAQRIKRFTKRNKFTTTTSFSKKMRKKMHRELGKKSIEVKETPDMKEVEEFWSNIWEKPKHYNKEAAWLPTIEQESAIGSHQQVWHKLQSMKQREL